jgi:hypothetical protein
MSALLAEGMPYTEVASVVGKSEYFVRKSVPVKVSGLLNPVEPGPSSKDLK